FAVASAPMGACGAAADARRARRVIEGRHCSRRGVPSHPGGWGPPHVQLIWKGRPSSRFSTCSLCPMSVAGVKTPEGGGTRLRGEASTILRCRDDVRRDVLRWRHRVVKFLDRQGGGIWPGGTGRRAT